MEIRTENLTILFVDIAGFTAVTSQQSRKQNAQLLDSFNKVLLPLIRRFKGRVVKSIGDALLVTLRSPTDAMLCSMALQDAIHEANLRVNDSDRIHIRVAASLGEVRVTKNDIFGEPVNVASRIEGITPADEIYLSEAVYLAMNKAEVPAKEVGFRELAGIAGNIRIYSIPRFATPRLVPEQAPIAEAGSELVYPYGGMHFKQKMESQGTFGERFSTLGVGKGARSILIPFVATVSIVLLAAAGLVYGFFKSEEPKTEVVAAKIPTAAVTSTPVPARAEVEVLVPGPTTVPSPPQSDSPIVAPTAAIPTGVPAVSVSVVPTVLVPTTPAVSPTSNLVPTAKTARPKATAKPVIIWNVISAKAAYRAQRISKADYKAIIQRLEAQYEGKIRSLKLAYRARSISRDVYERRVLEAKRAFRGQ